MGGPERAGHHVGRARSREAFNLSRVLTRFCLFLLPIPGFLPLPPHRRPSSPISDRVALLLPRRFFLLVLLPLSPPLPLGSFAPTPSCCPAPSPTQGNDAGEGESRASPGLGLSLKRRPEAEQRAASERPGRRQES